MDPVCGDIRAHRVLHHRRGQNTARLGFIELGSGRTRRATHRDVSLRRDLRNPNCFRLGLACRCSFIYQFDGVFISC